MATNVRIRDIRSYSLIRPIRRFDYIFWNKGSAFLMSPDSKTFRI